MSEEVKTSNEVKPTENQGTIQKEEVKTTDQKQDQKKDNQDSQKELLGVLVDDKLKDIKDFYEKKIDELKKTNAGLDRKVSEQTKVIKEYTKKELTEAEVKDLERKERKDEYHRLYTEQAIAKFNLYKEEDDINFSMFLFSSEEEPEKMRNEIFEKGKILKEYLDKNIKIGIEKGVNDRLAAGYKPGSAINSNKVDDFENMNRDDLKRRAQEISKMQPSKEKTDLLNRLMIEQTKRLKD